MSIRDPLSRTFSALADPTRRAILERLAAGEAGVAELTEAFTLTQPAITKHLKVLETAGLIDRTREGQRRPARLQIEGLLPVDDWLRRAHAEWSDRLDRLCVYLAGQTDSTITEEIPDARDSPHRGRPNCDSDQAARHRARPEGVARAGL